MSDWDVVGDEPLGQKPQQKKADDPWAVVETQPADAPTRINAMQAVDRNPATVAEADQLARRHGVPVETAERNLPDLRRQSEAEDAAALAVSHPKAAEWLGADPDNAAVARGDWGVLKTLETVFKATTPIGAMTSALMTNPGRSAVASVTGLVGSGIEGMAEVPKMAERRMTGGAGLDPVYKLYRDVFGVDIDYGGKLQEGGRAVGGFLNTQAENVDVPDSEKTLGDQLAAGVASGATSIAAGFVPGAGPALWAGYGIDMQADRAREAGNYGTAQADTAMTVGGSITALTEALGFKWLKRALPPKALTALKSRIGDLLSAGAGEGVQEVTEQLSHDLLTRELTDPSQQIGGYWDDGALGFAVGMLMRGGQHINKSAADAEDAVAERDALSGLIDATQASSLFKSSPFRFKSAVEQLKSQGMSDVYVPIEAWQTLFQSDPAASDSARKAAGISDADFASALMSGGRVRVPVAGFLTELTAEQQTALAKDSRFKPDGFTPPEAEGFDADEAMAEYFKTAGVGRPSGVVSDVYNEYVNRLTGPYSKADAEYLAEYVAALTSGYGSRSGMQQEIADLWINNLTVAAEGRIPERLQKVLAGRKDVVPEVDSVLDALRAGAFPSDSDVFGPTLTEAVRSWGGIDPNSFGASDLRSQDAQKVGVFSKSMNGGLLMEYALERAVQEGYLPEGSDLNAFLEAMTSDLQGAKPVYSAANLNDSKQSFSNVMEQAAEELRDRGIDLAKVSNAEARRLMGMQSARGTVSDAASELDQPTPGSGGRAPGSWYRSDLVANISTLRNIAAKDGSVAVDQVKAWIESRIREGKFKKAEVEAVGLIEYLDGQGARANVADVVAFVEQNGVQVTETVLGGDVAADTIKAAFNVAGYGLEFDPLVPLDEQEAMFTDPDGDEIEFNELPESLQRVILENTDKPGDHIDAPKFSQFVLPGGSNYRELLLTLPQSDATSKKPRELLGGDPEKMTPDEASDSMGSENMFEDDIEFVLMYPSGGYIEQVRGGGYRVNLGRSSHESSNLADLERALLVEWGGELEVPQEDIASLEGFVSSHYPNPNILAHVRFNERTDSDGARVLFIEEIQSDWAQQGRKQGFRKLEPSPIVAPLNEEENAEYIRLGKIESPTPEEDARYSDLWARANPREVASSQSAPVGVPSAPFVTDTNAWTQLAIKRMVAYAVEQGFDKVAFINGEQSADRYDLSKKVDSITVVPLLNNYRSITIVLPNQSIKVQVDASGTITSGREEFVGKGLDEAVGKDLADRLMAATDTETLKGNDLKIGGTGMKAFYDKIVPQNVRAVLKKLGGELGEVSFPKTGAAVDIDWKAFREDATEVSKGEMAYSDFIDDHGVSGIVTELELEELDNRDPFAGRRRAQVVSEFVKSVKERVAAGKRMTQLGFTITPTMRETVRGGIALFQSQPSEATLKDQDKRWYFSAVAQAVTSSKTNKAPGDQWLATIRNTPGVRVEEIEWLGLPKFLAGKKSLTREDVQAYVRSREVVVEETFFGPPAGPRTFQDAEISGAYSLLAANQITPLLSPDESSIGFQDTGDGGEDGEILSIDDMNQYGYSNEVIAAAVQVENYIFTKGISAYAPYQNMKLSGGENYRVLVLRFPSEGIRGLSDSEIEDVDATVFKQTGGNLGEEYSDTLRAGGGSALALLEDINDRIAIGMLGYVIRKVKLDGVYTHGHFDTLTNFFAHARFEDRTDADGNRVLFIMELQSDWHQQGSRMGYKGAKDQTVFPTVEQMAADIEWELTYGHGDLDAYVSVVYPDGSEAAHLKSNIYGFVQREWVSSRLDLFRRGQRDLPDAYWAVITEQAQAINADIKNSQSGIPDAPFKKTWYEVMIKRLVRFAAENGYHSVALPRPDQVPRIEGWSTSYEQIKGEPGNRYESIVGRYEDEYVRTIKALAKKYGGETAGSALFSSGKNVKNDNFDELWGLTLFKVAIEEGLTPQQAVKLQEDATDELEETWREFTNDGGPPGSDAEAHAGSMRAFMSWRADELIDSERNDEAVRRGRIFNAAYVAVLTSPDFIDIPLWVDDSFEAVFGHMIRQAKSDKYEGDGAPPDANTIMTMLRSEMRTFNRTIPPDSALSFRDFAEAYPDLIEDREAPADSYIIDMVNQAYAETRKHPLTRLSRPRDIKNPSLVITPRLRLAAMSGLPLFQRNTQDRKRGSLSIMPDGSWVMNLLKARDWSTFLHESSHVQLEIMRQIDAKLRAADPATLTADQRGLLVDHDALLAWMGAADFASVTVDMHEQFAETFEAYLREGKAPSTALRSAFRRFATWLKAIYHSITKLPNAKLNDDIRAVMDRMLATDAEIAEAQSDLSLAPKFSTPAEAGMTDDEFARYQEAARLARETAMEQEFQRQYAYEKREQQAWYRAERKRIRGEVQAELNDDLTYQAAAFMRRGTMPDGSPRPDGRKRVRMDSDGLLNEYGNEFIKRNLSGMYGKDGAPADAIAPLFGFDSGRAMIEALANQRPYAAHLEAETERRLTEQYPDPMTDGESVDRAGAAVNNEYSEKVLLREIQQVERWVAGSKPTVAAVMRDAAKRIISQSRIMDLKPSKHRAAEQKAGRDAVKALASGDFQEALTLLRRQMMAGMLYRESMLAKGEAEKQFKHAQNLAKKPAQERLAKAAADYLEQINAILGAFEFRRTTNKEISRRRKLSAWVEDRQAAGDVTAVSEELLARVEAQATKNWREATVQEMSDAYEAMRNIEHLAGLKNKLLKARRAADHAQAVDEMLLRVETTLPDLIADVVDDSDLTVAQRAAKKVRAAIDDLTRPEILFEILDGGESGPFHDFLHYAQVQAEAAKNALRRRVADQLKALHVGLPPGFWESMDQKVTIKGVSTTRYTLLAAVLNKGNAGNRQRLRDGGITTSSGMKVELTDAEVDALPGMLTAAELRYVQGLWDVAESMRPDIESLQQRMAGVPVGFVESVPFSVVSSDGVTVEMRGGYWPLVYHSDRSAVGERQADDDALKIMMGQGVSRAATSKGYTKDRVDDLRAALRLNLGMVLSKNLDEVMTDIAYREAVRDVQGLLNDQRLKSAIIARLGRSAYNSLRGSLAYSVSGSADTVGMAAQSWRDATDFMMANASVAALAIRPDIALGNYTSAVVQGLSRVDNRAMFRGMRELWLNRKDMTAEIKELSPFMAARLDDLDSHYAKQITRTQNSSGFRAAYFRFMMTLHRMADHDVTRAVWYGRYTQERAAGVDKDEAIRIADKTIRTTQTASGRKDLATYERDTAFKQTRMFMGPMFVIFGQVRNATGGSGVADTTGARLALGMNALFFAPAVFALAAGRWADDDDDDGLDLSDWARWVAVNCGPMFALQTMPIVREVASAIESAVSGRPVNPRAAPTSQAVATMIKSTKSLWEQGKDIADGDEVDFTRLTSDLLGVTAPLSGLPASQFRKSSRAVEWINENPDASAQEMAAVMLYGPPYK